METYIKTYDINKIKELTRLEMLILFELANLTRVGSYNETNKVILNRNIRKRLCTRVGLTNVLSLGQYLNSLIKKGFMVREGINQFMMNPNIIGKGTEKNIAIARKFYGSDLEIDEETGEIKEGGITNE